MEGRLPAPGIGTKIRNGLEETDDFSRFVEVWHCWKCVCETNGVFLATNTRVQIQACA